MKPNLYLIFLLNLSLGTVFGQQKPIFSIVQISPEIHAGIQGGQTDYPSVGLNQFSIQPGLTFGGGLHTRIPVWRNWGVQFGGVASFNLAVTRLKLDTQNYPAYTSDPFFKGNLNVFFPSLNVPIGVSWQGYLGTKNYLDLAGGWGLRWCGDGLLPNSGYTGSFGDSLNNSLEIYSIMVRSRTVAESYVWFSAGIARDISYGRQLKLSLISNFAFKPLYEGYLTTFRFTPESTSGNFHSNGTNIALQLSYVYGLRDKKRIKAEHLVNPPKTIGIGTWGVSVGFGPAFLYRRSNDPGNVLASVWYPETDLRVGVSRQFSRKLSWMVQADLMSFKDLYGVYFQDGSKGVQGYATFGDPLLGVSGGVSYALVQTPKFRLSTAVLAGVDYYNVSGAVNGVSRIVPFGQTVPVEIRHQLDSQRRIIPVISANLQPELKVSRSGVIWLYTNVSSGVGFGKPILKTVDYQTVIFPQPNQATTTFLGTNWSLNFGLKAYLGGNKSE